MHGSQRGESFDAKKWGPVQPLPVWEGDRKQAKRQQQPVQTRTRCAGGLAGTYFGGRLPQRGWGATGDISGRIVASVRAPPAHPLCSQRRGTGSRQRGWSWPLGPVKLRPSSTCQRVRARPHDWAHGSERVPESHLRPPSAPPFPESSVKMGRMIVAPTAPSEEVLTLCGWSDRCAARPLPLKQVSGASRRCHRGPSPPPSCGQTMVVPLSHQRPRQLPPPLQRR